MPLYHYGFSGNIGAGTYDRRGSIVVGKVTHIPDGGDSQPGPVQMTLPTPPLSGLFQFDDSKTYLPDADIAGVENLTLQADSFERPYIKREVTGGTEWVFAAEPKPAHPDPEEDLRNLMLEGLWMGSKKKALPHQRLLVRRCPPRWSWLASSIAW